jgi:hypothetical protein
VVDHEPEKAESVLQSWLGNWVELHYAASSAEVTPHGEMITGPVETRIGTCRLEAMNEKGIEASLPDAGERSTLFIPWHSVLLLQGPSRQEMEQNQSEQTAEASPARRQELMDLLASAESPTQVVVARAAADSWLASNPSDGDVRMARDQLPDL